MVEKMLLRADELATALGICRSKAYALIASGEIPSVRIGGCVRVPVEQLKGWIASRTSEVKS